MGIFQRQLWKQKPQAWGPFSAVQSALFHNADRMGLPIPELFIPFWERVGATAHNYGSTIPNGVINPTYATWDKNELKIASSVLAINYGYASLCAPSLSSKATIWQRIRLGVYSKAGANCVYNDTTDERIWLGLDGAQGYIDVSLRLGEAASALYDASASGGYIWGDLEGKEVDIFLTLNGSVGNVFLDDIQTHTDYSYSFAGALNSDFGINGICGTGSSIIAQAVFPDVLSNIQRQSIRDSANQLVQPVPQKTIFLPLGGDTNLPIKINGIATTNISKINEITYSTIESINGVS